MSKIEFSVLMENAQREQRAESAGFSCYLEQEEKRKLIRETRLREALMLRRQELRKIAFSI